MDRARDRNVECRQTFVDLLALSAQSEVGLRERAARLRAALADQPKLKLGDICHTSQCRTLPLRAALRTAGRFAG